MDEGRELQLPPAVKLAEEATEIARIWLVADRQHVVLPRTLWNDPAAWGLMLADLARHVAKAYAAQGHSSSEVLERIRQGFDAEWASPTELPE